MDTQPVTVIQLDPAAVIADSLENSRFDITKLSVDKLAESILTAGGVERPIEVTELSPEERKEFKGKTHRLLAGYIRHAAVTQLNKEQQAGLTLPAIVVTVESDLDRLKRQLRENMDREKQSPMDRATAMQQLKDLGVSMNDMRRIFASPGGRKGLQMQPASNAHINMTLSFLELPKAIQAKIHDGRIGVAAAYELTKVAPEDRQRVLDRAEDDRQRQMDREDNDENKWLKAQERVQVAEAKAQEAEAAITKAKEEAAAAAEAVAEKQKAAEAAYALRLKAAKADDKAKAAAEEHFKAAEQDAKAAEKLRLDAQKALDKQIAAKKTAAETIAGHKAKLDAARKKGGGKGAVPANKKKLTPKDIAAAAVAEGAGERFVKLKLSDINVAVAKLVLPGTHKLVIAIGQALQRCFNGETTDDQLVRDLEALVTPKKVTAK